jgi:ABC-type nitrate/sulfonate/bicarbonate transport system permease component
MTATRAVRTTFAPFAGILVFLALWQAGVAWYRVPAYLLPAPTQIFRTLVNELPRLLHHSWVPSGARLERHEVPAVTSNVP